MYNLQVNEEQLAMIQKALDLYSRLGIGQVEELANPFTSPYPIVSEKGKEILKEFKKEVFPELDSGAYYSIFSKEAPENAKIGYDLIQVIRNFLAYERKPEGGITVDFDTPMQTSEQPLSKIERIESEK